MTMPTITIEDLVKAFWGPNTQDDVATLYRPNMRRVLDAFKPVVAAANKDGLDVGYYCIGHGKRPDCTCAKYTARIIAQIKGGRSEMTTPLEACARAIADWQQPGTYDEMASVSPFDSTQLHQDHFLIMARAAIEAISSNVTDEMVQAFRNAMEPHTDGNGWHYDRAIAAAIRAALSEGQV